MKITRFKFDDHGADWHLEETAFDQLNLLVGVSGVGKTKILEALRRVCRMATGSKVSSQKIEWFIEFEHDGHSYQWDGMTGAKPSEGLLKDVSSDEEETIFIRERLASVGELPLIERDHRGIRFRDQIMPPLAELGSALHILKSEKELSAVHQAFSHMTFSNAASLKRTAVPIHDIPNAETPTEIGQKLTFDDFLSRFGSLSLTAFSAYVLQESYPEKFSQIKDDFIDIFTSLTDIRIELSPLRGDEQKMSFQFAIQERG